MLIEFIYFLKREYMYISALHHLVTARILLVLCMVCSLSSCHEPDKIKITKVDEVLQSIDMPTQTASFQLIEEDSGELLADGFSLEAIAQASSPVVDGEIVQATDVLWTYIIL